MKGRSNILDQKRSILKNLQSCIYMVTITAKGTPVTMRPISTPITRVTEICFAHHPLSLSIEIDRLMITITMLNNSYLILLLLFVGTA
jgi:hypothetical protein